MHVLSFALLLLRVQLQRLFRLLVLHHVLLPRRNLTDLPFLARHHRLLQDFLVSHWNQPQNLWPLGAIRGREVSGFHNDLVPFRFFPTLKFSLQTGCVGVVLWISVALLEKSKERSLLGRPMVISLGVGFLVVIVEFISGLDWLLFVGADLFAETFRAGKKISRQLIPIDLYRISFGAVAFEIFWLFVSAPDAQEIGLKIWKVPLSLSESRLAAGLVHGNKNII